MDKFGIFNILSSLLQSFNNTEKTGENIFSSMENKTDKNETNPLSELFNIFKNQTGKKEENPLPVPQVNTESPNQKEKAKSALKTRLLQTATSHDEFVKRVTKNNKV